MLYKSDWQSDLGTRATGNNCYFRYTIFLQNSTDSEKNPTDVFDVPWISCSDENIVSKYSLLQDTGKWMMFFELEDLNEKWSLAKRCYKEGKLNGIIRMEVSTMFENPKRSPGQHGVILFYCGPSSNEKLMKRYGRNLLKHIPYQNKTKKLTYKSSYQSVLGTRATGNKSNHLYSIPI